MPDGLRRWAELLLAMRFPYVLQGVPCARQHTLAIKAITCGTVRMMRYAESALGGQFLDEVRRVNEQLGAEIARHVIEKYQISRNLTGALKLIQLQIIPFDIRMKVIRIGRREFEIEKTKCPMWEVFVSEGRLYCEAICLAATRGALHELKPCLRVSFSRPPDASNLCRKLIELCSQDIER